VSDIYLDDKNFHFETIPNPSDENSVTLKVYQKTRIGNVFVKDMPNVPKNHLEYFTNLIKSGMKFDRIGI